MNGTRMVILILPVELLYTINIIYLGCATIGDALMLHCLRDVFNVYSTKGESSNSK